MVAPGLIPGLDGALPGRMRLARPLESKDADVATGHQMTTIPLPIVSKRDVHRALLADGWIDVSRPRSDHFMLEHPDRPGRRVRLSHGSKPLTKPVINNIIEQGGYTRESFVALIDRT